MSNKRELINRYLRWLILRIETETANFENKSNIVTIWLLLGHFGIDKVYFRNYKEIKLCANLFNI